MDGIIEWCEVHDCMMNVENTWRIDACPEAEPLYCMNPYHCESCKVWTCEDIMEKTECVMNDWDSNNDGSINL